jgi:L-aminopeptidase/D-esterase-like protein
VVATDARIDKPGCTLLARQAHAGLARAIAPYGTALDGDIAFAVATGQHDANPIVVGNAAAEMAAAAARDAVRSATSVRGVPTAADLRGRA